ncbi:MAG: hypothetical protein V3U24_01435 [Candidatus Neomarinimicrobiota bacterium]
MKVFAIARLTYSVERHRSEILILALIGFVLAFSMSLISLSPALTSQVLGYASSDRSLERSALMLQGGLFYSEICVFLIGFLIAMNTFSGDKKSGILDIVLSKQLTRSQYLTGKFLGAFILCCAAYLVMILPIVGSTVYSGQWGVSISTTLSYLSGCVKVIIYLSLTFFFLMRLPRFLAPMMGLVFVAMGYFSQSLSLMHANSEGIWRWLSMISYYFIPHLTEVTVASIFSPLPGSGPDYAKWFLVYGLLYPGVFLLLSLKLFKRRSL